MSNVVQIERSCAYLVNRAARHRRSGRYDEAMALLTKAKDQFGFHEEIELETALVYEEMGCDEEASRSYLRVVRADGAHKGQALFHLALSALQRGDAVRAASYYQLYCASPQDGISREMTVLLARQLDAQLVRALPSGRKGRAAQLRQRALVRIQQGKAASAAYALRHALKLRPSAQGYMLLACCHLLRGETNEALANAKLAHQKSPAHVQALCVLADTYLACGENALGRRSVYLAALRARSAEDLHAAAMESAKHGEDRLTLYLTRRLLRREPFHTQGMMLRACAMINLGNVQDAARLMGRLCGLLPENSVCEAYFRKIREGEAPEERLDIGLEITRQEGIDRASELISMLYEAPETICSDRIRLRNACRYGAWAIRSGMAGARITTVALILLCSLPAREARETLLDALADPAVADSLKMSILQVLTGKEGFKPYWVDYEGKLVRLAAGGVSSRAMNSEHNSRIVQRACDALGGRFPDAPGVLLPIYLGYLDRYGEVKRRQEPACAAALEYIYHHLKNHEQVLPDLLAQRYGVTVRMCCVYIRRLTRVCAALRSEENRTEDER